jgi:H/ACA ribonucleoprotein complex subunit 4
MKIDIQKIKQEKSMKELLEFSIVNMDKPSGPTSFQVDTKLKNWLGLRKTSHFGTLDPKVTGVLPIALNRACKLSDYFMHRDKIYIGIMHVHSDISKEKLEKEMKKFVGKIIQLPPKKSRVKRAERVREVKKFEILEMDGRDVVFFAEVEAGTYIRKLCSDLGEKIGGAHMTELRRIKASMFDEKDESFVNLYDFKEAVEEYKKGNDQKLRKILIPAEIISEILPVVQVNPKDIKHVLTGKPLMKKDLKGALPKEEKFAVFLGDKFIEVARKVDYGEIVARPEFVLN